jgi:hypothetical protein
MFVKGWAQLAVYQHLSLASPRQVGLIERLTRPLHPHAQHRSSAVDTGALERGPGPAAG